MQEIRTTGLGSLEEIYLCIIPPLSRRHRLPSAHRVIDWVDRQVAGPGYREIQSERNISEAWAWLLAAFPNGNLVAQRVACLLFSRLLGLALDLAEVDKELVPPPCLRVRQYAPKDALRLLEARLRKSDWALYPLEVFHTCCPI